LIPQLLQVRETLDALVRRLELGNLGMRPEHLAIDSQLLLLGEQGDACSEMVLGGKLPQPLQAVLTPPAAQTYRV
jgi:hypothetical protein